MGYPKEGIVSQDNACGSGELMKFSAQVYKTRNIYETKIKILEELGEDDVYDGESVGVDDHFIVICGRNSYNRAVKLSEQINGGV